MRRLLLSIVLLLSVVTLDDVERCWLCDGYGIQCFRFGGIVIPCKCNQCGGSGRFWTWYGWAITPDD